MHRFADKVLTGWSVTTLKQYYEVAHQDLKDLIFFRLQEIDTRHQQRYSDTEKRFEEKLIALEKLDAMRASSSAQALSTALAYSEKAVQKAEEQQRQHNHTQNEWRGTVTDLTSVVAERARHETETMVEALSQRLDVSIRSLSGRIEDSKSRLDKLEGRAGGASATYTAIAAGLAAVIALIGVFISFSNSNSIAARIPSKTEIIQEHPLK